MQFKDDAEVRGLVQKVERCELAPSEFDHENHLAVGMAYLAGCGAVEAALDKLRATLLRYTAHLGKTVYHETMTRFWLLRLEDVRAANAGAPLHRLCAVAAAELGNKELVYEYYDREVLMSDEARKQWVGPRRYPIVVPARGGGM